MSDKRRAAQGYRGGNLTPAQARSTLAVPVYAILQGQAMPVFPGTSLAAPSGLVGIFKTPGGSCRILPKGEIAGFPVWLNDRQWERAVVPVLLDPRFQSSNVNFQVTASTNLSSVIGMIGEALAVSFHEAGYGPLPDPLP